MPDPRCSSPRCAGLDHDEARAISRVETTSGAAISVQTWGIAAKIREWDAVAEHEVIGVHPELSFRARRT